MLPKSELERYCELVASLKLRTTNKQGRPKLLNDLRRPTMEEIGHRTDIFTLEGVAGSQRKYIIWLLGTSTAPKRARQFQLFLAAKRVRCRSSWFQMQVATTMVNCRFLRFGYTSTMRLFIALILCFAVSVQGFANPRIFKQPCPMEQMVEAGMASTGDCCNDADTVAKTGKLCKTELPCTTTAAILESILAIAAPDLHSSSPAPGIQPAPPLSDPATVWRPPSLV